MACNYADGLSPYENKGKLGLPEVFDDETTVEEKIEKLAEWIRQAKHVVVHTGAGISTAAGIPDFRGPKGVWTLEEKGLKPEICVSFDTALPTRTHMGLTALTESGHVKYVISQNIDGLHLRSGIKRSCISELHGNMFIARCSYCGKEFVQTGSVPTVGQKEIGVACPSVKAGGRCCRGKLRDNILDWEHNLPEKDLEMADIHSALADLSICLGTTLQIVPAGNLPLKAKKNKGKLVIVNLQPTKHHKRADLVIHTQVDKVINKISELLGVEIPLYSEEIDPTCILKRLPNRKGLGDWTIGNSWASKLKALLPSNSNPKKDSKPRKRRRRRRKSEMEDSESDDEDDKVNTKVHISENETTRFPTITIKSENPSSDLGVIPAPGPISDNDSKLNVCGPISDDSTPNGVGSFSDPDSKMNTDPPEGLNATDHLPSENLNNPEHSAEASTTTDLTSEPTQKPKTETED